MAPNRLQLIIGLVMFGLTPASAAGAQQHLHTMAPTTVAVDSTTAIKQLQGAKVEDRASVMPTSSHSPIIFTLRTGIAEGRMVYIGVGGDIDHKVNPTLTVHEGETVQINLVNGEGAQHDAVIEQYAARSAVVSGKNASSTFSFVANKVGEFDYYCSIPGHRQAEMQGLLQVVPGNRAEMQSTATDITRDPADLPGADRSASAENGAC